MGTTDKRDYDVAIRRFLEHNLGMGRYDELPSPFLGYLGEQVVGLALTEGFEVRIRLVEEQYRPGIGIEVGK